MRVVHQLAAHLVTEHDLLIGHEQDEQDRRVAGEREPAPLARRVDDDVQIAGAGSVRETAGLIPDGVPLVCSKGMDCRSR